MCCTAFAKMSFSIDKKDGTESNFTAGNGYRCVKHGDGDLVISDDNGNAIKLDMLVAADNFWIK